MAAISLIESIGGGWGRRGVGSHRRAKSKHSNTNGSAVPSVSDPGWHNSQGRPGLLLESVWHPMQPY